ncbi:Laminin subunit alpha [Portunus trituberculatus]|uniref:Laminin subunit alpha n=1 Tax=Portunus trituberculatus TaxID=210409 RepID=A0A5B7FEL3_PORTR|nr:Laminin subunit alpha [Portunus trituberculatus]
MFHFWVVVLFFVFVDTECQSNTLIRTQCRVTCNTNPSRPRTATQLCSERQSQFRSSPSLSRYSVYEPLNAYWKQYGSNVKGANHSVVTINTDRQSESRSDAISREQYILGQQSSQWQNLIKHNGRRQEKQPAYSTSPTHQIYSHHGQQSEARRPSIRTSTSVTAPPLIKSSTGFTLYSTLEKHGQGRRGGSGQGKHSGIPSRNRGEGHQGTAFHRRGEGYPERKSQSVSGEGFGEAYLRWSEYGIGCSCDECGTRNCEHFSGVCQCFENVIGEDCDRCAQDHWGFASCQVGGGRMT